MTASINASTSSGVVVTSDTSGSLAVQSNGTTKFTVDSTGAYGQITSGTAVASTSGTSINFTSIPSWVSRITIMFSAVSTSGTSVPIIQLGNSGGVETTGYLSWGSQVSASSAAAASYTTGFGIGATSAATSSRHGAVTLTLLNAATFTWVAAGVITDSGNSVSQQVSGSKSLTTILDRVRITTVNGTDTFDAGSINILYEG